MNTLNKKKILIIGASGYLGARIIKYFNNFEICLSSQKNDVFIDLKKKVFPKIGKFDVIINFAGISNIEKCEILNKKIVDYINFQSTTDILENYSKSNTQLINISSSHVFKGIKEKYAVDDEREPQNYYGYTKCKLEDFTLKSNGTIIRATKIIDDYFPRFTDWYKKLINQIKIEVPDDLTVSLVHYNEFAKLLKKIIELNIRGIEQISSERSLTYYDLSKFLAKSHNLNENLIIPFKLSKHSSINYGRYCTMKQTSNSKLINKKTNTKIIEALKL